MGSKKDLIEEFSYEEMDQFVYVKQCFYESLRLETPIQISSAMMFTQDTKLGDYVIKKHDQF
jgi:cytochrome P450